MSNLTSGIEFLNIQGGMFRLLEADTTLTGMVTGIYDVVPTGSSFPYVTMGQVQEVAANTLTHIGRECNATVHVWSRSGGFQEAIAIADRIVLDLDNQMLTWTESTGEPNWSSYCQYYSGHPIADPDGLTRHVILVFHIGVQR